MIVGGLVSVCSFVDMSGMFSAICCKRGALSRREVEMSWEGVYRRCTCVQLFHVVMCRLGSVRVSCG
jgi:hypothetical protein